MEGQARCEPCRDKRRKGKSVVAVSDTQRMTTTQGVEEKKVEAKTESDLYRKEIIIMGPVEKLADGRSKQEVETVRQ